VKMDMLPTTLMINVLSSHDVEAERLAFFVWEQVSAFREAIISTMPGLLYLGQRGSLSAPSPAGALVDSTEREWTVVVVSFPCFLQHATTIQPLNRPILSGARIGMTAQGQSPRGGVTPTVPLQGTAPSQPQLSRRDRRALSEGRVELPQEGGDEAESTSPLTVTIET
jgi:hypothetical protein